MHISLVVQSYRNYSRTIKQYLYGNKENEEMLIMELRNQFRIPFTCYTPCAEIKHGGERRMADQLDRDYELISYNQHPAVLYMYQLQNSYIKKNNDMWEQTNRGEISIDQLAVQEMEKLYEA